MGDFRVKTIKQIRDDYVEKGSESVLAEFILSEKRKKVKAQAEKLAQNYENYENRIAQAGEPENEKKRERHDLLAEFLWTLGQRGERDEDWFIKAIIDWIERLQKDDRFTLYYKREKTSGGERASRGAACRAIMALREKNEKKKKKEKPAAELLDKASDEIRNCLIEQSAAQLLYDLGYPLGKDRRGRKSSAQNTALDLIDAWCSERGTDGAHIQAGTAFDEEAYQELYDLLNKEKKTRALIPVRIDPETGMGIYIMGRELYPSGEEAYWKYRFDSLYRYTGKARYMSCGISFVGCWMESSTEGEPDHLTISFHTAEGDGEEEEEELRGFPDIEEANTWFIRNFLEAQDQEKRFFAFLEYNGKAPKGLPEQFLKYFGRAAPKASDDLAPYSEEDRAEMMAKFGQDKFRGM